LIIFFDDCANTTVVGNAFRPVTDKLGISREKFSYIVDSTAAPVASLALISTWIGYEVGLIGDAIEGTPVSLTPYTIFLQSIPYRFYSIFAIILVLFVCLISKRLWPYVKSRISGRTTGKVFADEATPLSAGSKLKVLEAIPQKTINMVIPIIVLIGVSIFRMWWTGGGISTEPFTDAISNADAMTALLWGGVFAVIVAIFPHFCGSCSSKLYSGRKWYTSCISLVFRNNISRHFTLSVFQHFCKISWNFLPFV